MSAVYTEKPSGLSLRQEMAIAFPAYVSSMDTDEFGDPVPLAPLNLLVEPAARSPSHPDQPVKLTEKQIVRMIFPDTTGDRHYNDFNLSANIPPLARIPSPNQTLQTLMPAKHILTKYIRALYPAYGLAYEIDD